MKYERESKKKLNNQYIKANHEYMYRKKLWPTISHEIPI